jgi:hypothetical protein
MSLICLTVLTIGLASRGSSEEIWPQDFKRVHDKNTTPLQVVGNGKATCNIILPQESELLRNAADWIADFTQRNSGAELSIVGTDGLKPNETHIVAVVGNDDPLVKRLTKAGSLQLDPQVGPQGFVLQRVSDLEAGELLVCWSPEPLGCRYGLIEILRSLKVEGQSVTTDIGRVVERPRFPMRICYVNFTEHLQNAFNPNIIFDVPANRWTFDDWDRFIDMVSAFRYNIFEFWLPPTHFSPEAMKGGKVYEDFAKTINHVIQYAKRRGVGVNPIFTINTVGQKWHFHCPNDPKEHAELVALWDYWSRTMKGNDYIGLFPGDPGGCIRNGCTAETYVDLCVELSKVIRKNNPTVKIEVGTWGEPFGGWGVPLWTGDRKRVEKSMRYFMSKLPEFPSDMFTSVNQGFSGDCDPNQGGGDGRPWAKEIAKTRTVLTWDYSVTEGEGTVSPRCRARRIFEQRRKEASLGFYSGGICYTMAPKLNCLSIFCSAEGFWNPDLKPEDVLADYGRLVFGDKLAAIGPLLEEFEVIPDWGYYAPFPYSPQRLQKSMAKLIPLLQELNPEAKPRLPIAPTMAEHRQSLLFYADLFRQLASLACDLDTGKELAKASGKTPAARENLLSLDELEGLVADPADFPHKADLVDVVERLKTYNVDAMRKSYIDTVYGIYNTGVPTPVDPRSGDAVNNLFKRFNCSLLAPVKSVLRPSLRATGKPHALILLGQPSSESGWTMNGWAMQGNDGDVTWRASGDAPGVIARKDFSDQGYKWIVVRLTEGPAGGKKIVAINGQKVAEFVRSGPPASVKKEWWVTRSFPIPEGVLKNGDIEIRFTEPGIAISEVALSSERIDDTK